MLEDLQEEFGYTCLFVAHGLSMVRHLSTRVAVMYLGRIVELAEADELCANLLHPYTQALLSAIPVADPHAAAAGSERVALSGEIPSPLDVPEGCRFRTRRRYAQDACAQGEPELRETPPGHFVVCWYAPGYEG